MTMLVAMTMEPTMSIGFRPTLSMINCTQSLVTVHTKIDTRRELTMAGTVLTMKTTPVTPVANRAVVPPVRPRVMKMLVA